jgi:hypothetical protein
MILHPRASPLQGAVQAWDALCAACAEGTGTLHYGVWHGEHPAIEAWQRLCSLGGLVWIHPTTACLL